MPKADMNTTLLMRRHEVIYIGGLKPVLLTASSSFPFLFVKAISVTKLKHGTCVMTCCSFSIILVSMWILFLNVDYLIFVFVGNCLLPLVAQISLMIDEWLLNLSTPLRMGFFFGGNQRSSRTSPASAIRLYRRDGEAGVVYICIWCFQFIV